MIMGFNISNSDKYTDNNSQEENNSMDIITELGRTKLMHQVSELVKSKPTLSQRISEARDQGGLEENEELHMALEELQRLEVEISRLQAVLEHSRILAPLPKGDYPRVVPGVTVQLENFNADKIVEYTLLGEYESDPGNGIISVKSPLGLELLNTKVGDEFELVRPGNTIEYEVLKVFVK